MKIILSYLLITIGSVSFFFEETFQSFGGLYKPEAPVVWAATNKLPESVKVYKVVPQSFSSTAISNLLKMAFFKLFNRQMSFDKQTWHFRYRDEYPIRILDMTPSLGNIHYFDDNASVDVSKMPGEMPHGVPREDELDKLAFAALQKLEINTNEIAPKIRRQMNNNVTLLGTNWTNGQVTLPPTILFRGVWMVRQIDGIPYNDLGARGGFSINFGNDAKIHEMDLCWRKLEAIETHKVATPKQIMAWIKSGKASRWVIDDNNEFPEKAKQLTITNVAPYYTAPEGNPMGATNMPFLKVEITADTGTTNPISFSLACPIFDVENK